MNLELHADVKTAILGLISGILAAVTNFFVKLASADLSTCQILLIMSLVISLLSLIAVILRKRVFAFDRRSIGYLLLYASFATSARFLFYCAIAYLPVFEAETIKNIRSTITLILLIISSQENLGIVEFAASLISFTGVVFVCRPSIFFGNMDNLNHLGLIFALLSAIIHAFAFITTKKISNFYYLHVTLFEYLIHALCAGILFFTIDYSKFTSDTFPYLMVLLASISLFFCTATQVLALYNGSAAVVSVTKNVNVPTLFLMQCLIQKQIPSYLSIIGAILLCVGVIAVNIRAKLNKILGKFTSAILKTFNYKKLPDEEEINLQ